MEIKDKTLPQLLKRIASEIPNAPAQYSKDKSGKFQEIKYKEVYETVKNFAGGLRN